MDAMTCCICLFNTFITNKTIHRGLEIYNMNTSRVETCYQHIIEVSRTMTEGLIEIYYTMNSSHYHYELMHGGQHRP